MAAMAAAGIAKGKYITTAIESFKLAISGFIIPYLIIFNPVLILRPNSLVWGLISLFSIILGLSALTMFVYGYFISKLSILERFSTFEL